MSRYGKIKISGLQVFEKNDELEKGHVRIEVHSNEYLDLVDEDDMINHLENNGYTVTEDDITDTLDIVDSKRLDEISRLFINGSWSEREEIYKKIFG